MDEQKASFYPHKKASKSRIMSNSGLIWWLGSINYFLTMTLGNGTHYIIIAFERYGADPRKRSIGNQMVSFACQCFIAHTVVSGSVFAGYLWFGPVGHVFGTLSVMVKAACGLAVCLAFLEHVLYKCLLVFCYYLASNIDEDFLGCFLKLFNLMVGALISAIHAILRIIYSDVYATLSGQEEIPRPK